MSTNTTVDCVVYAYCLWCIYILYLLMLHPQVLSIIVFDPFTELFITLCIVVNVLFMSADHYDVEYDGMWVLQSTSPGSDSIWIIQNMAKSLRSISRSVVLVTPVLLYLYWLYGLLVGLSKSKAVLLWVHNLSVTNNMRNYFQINIQDYYFIFYPFLLESYVLDLLDNVQK